MPKVKLDFETQTNQYSTELATFTEFADKGGLPYKVVLSESLLDFGDRWMTIARREWGDEIIHRSKGKRPAIKAALNDANGVKANKPPKSRARKF